MSESEPWDLGGCAVRVDFFGDSGGVCGGEDGGVDGGVLDVSGVPKPGVSSPDSEEEEELGDPRPSDMSLRSSISSILAWSGGTERCNEAVAVSSMRKCDRSVLNRKSVTSWAV